MDNMDTSLQSTMRDETLEVQENGTSRLPVKWNTGKTTFVDVAEWQDGPDALDKRSDIVHAIIHNQHLQNLEYILKCGWDVNELLDIPKYVFKVHNSIFGYQLERYQSTTLLEAIKTWKEVVELLLLAGADSNLLTPTSLSPLEQALSKSWSPNDKQDIIRLLLKHGANVEIHSSTSKGIVALAIENEFDIKTVELLIQNGADPNVRSNEMDMTSMNGSPPNVLHLVVSKIPRRSNYDDSWTQLMKSNIVFLKMLLDYGADINWIQEKKQPLLHRIVLAGNSSYARRLKPPFLPDHLDIYFQYGGDIDSDRYGDKGSALEIAVKHGGQSNSIRWLLRHGADATSLQMNLLKAYIIPSHIHYNGGRGGRLIKRIVMNETPLVLLKAGLRVSPRVSFQISEVKRRIELLIKQVHRGGPPSSLCGIIGSWAKLHEADELYALSERNFPRMTVSPSERKQQKADLQEFSDESLNVYPENDLMENPAEHWQCSVKTLQKILDFLSQPQTLQWWCRCCIRENLVSLHPSVVKNLPGPARLKRYILCHEL